VGNSRRTAGSGKLIPYRNSAQAQLVLSCRYLNAGTNMTDPRFEDRNEYPSGHHSRWPDPWRPEDHWGQSPPQFCFSLSWLDSSSTAAPTLEQLPFLMTPLRVRVSRLRCPQHTCFHLHQTYKYRSFPIQLALFGSAGPSWGKKPRGGNRARARSRCSIKITLDTFAS